MSDGRTWGSIIGGVVGYFTGGIGFAAGATIGGAIGGLLEPKKRTETNRIDDLKVSLSKYGDGIPETWGNNIPPATWIWSTYIIQVPEEQESGKGGGTVNTNYRQFIHGLLCLGKTPPPGSSVTIRKVWVNGKLTFDLSSGLSVAQALATSENPYALILLFEGRDGQLPLALIEAYEGVGNVPAFTGRLTLSIFALEVPGGRIPQISFEICINASYECTSSTLISFSPSFLAVVSNFGDPALVRMMYGPGWDNHYATKRVEVWEISLDGTKRISRSFDAAHNSAPAQGHSDETCFVNHAADGGSSNTLNYYTSDGVKQDILLPTAIAAEQTVFAKKGRRFVAGFSSVWSGGPYVFEDMSGSPRDMALGSYVADMALTDQYLYLMHDGVINRYELETLTLVDEVCAVPNYDIDQSSMNVIGDDEIYVMDWIENTVSRVSNGALSELFTDVEAVGGVMGGTFHVRGNVLLQNNDYPPAPFLRFVVRALATQEADVAELIQSQCDQAGLVGKTDVSTIDDAFWGYTFNKSPASARANITPVMTYSALGVVEEDGLLRFFHREDKASAATIACDELGCAESSAEPEDPFPVTHLNAQELPRSLTLSYNDPTFDYQVSTAKAMMLTSDSVLDATESIDMAISGDRAATIARRLLLERWIAQNSRTCAVSRKYAFLSAGDVITVEYPRGTQSLWMTSKITDTGARVEIECFPADSGLIIQSVPGPGGFQGQQIQPLAAPLQAVILDMPIMRDQDNDPGLYVALDSYAAVPASGELFVGNSDESLLPAGIVSSSAPIGFAETVLGDWQRNLVDETNIVTVNIGDDVFTNITRDQLLEGAENVWAMGAPGRWEIGKSRLGNSLGGGRYTLSSHLRGLFGTERCAALHQAGDVFVLLRIAGMLRPAMGVGDIGLAKRYRAVALGRSFDSATSQTYTNTGDGLAPLSPINLRRAFASRDLQVDRRSRLSMNNSTGSLPLGEASEAYRWRFYTDGTFATQIGEAITTTAAITAAQQTAIGVTPTATAYVKVAQVSDSVGAGHELQATA